MKRIKKSSGRSYKYLIVYIWPTIVVAYIIATLINFKLISKTMYGALMYIGLLFIAAVTIGSLMLYFVLYFFRKRWLNKNKREPGIWDVLIVGVISVIPFIGLGFDLPYIPIVNEILFAGATFVVYTASIISKFY